MTFEEFLVYIRATIGRYCTDEYWRWTYDNLKSKNPEWIKKETPFLAVHAVATDYTSRNT